MLNCVIPRFCQSRFLAWKGYFRLKCREALGYALPKTVFGHSSSDCNCLALSCPLQKLQSDFLVKGSLGAQRLFRRHHEYLSNLAVDSSLSLSDSSDDSSSSSSSSDEERK